MKYWAMFALRLLTRLCLLLSLLMWWWSQYSITSVAVRGPDSKVIVFWSIFGADVQLVPAGTSPLVRYFVDDIQDWTPIRAGYDSAHPDRVPILPGVAIHDGPQVETSLHIDHWVPCVVFFAAVICTSWRRTRKPPESDPEE